MKRPRIVGEVERMRQERDSTIAECERLRLSHNSLQAIVRDLNLRRDPGDSVLGLGGAYLEVNALCVDLDEATAECERLRAKVERLSAIADDSWLSEAEQERNAAIKRAEAAELKANTAKANSRPSGTNMKDYRPVLSLTQLDRLLYKIDHSTDDQGKVCLERSVIAGLIHQLVDQIQAYERARNDL